MSRSYKKFPIHPYASSKSERWDKIFWHSKFRAKTKQYIKTKMLYNDEWDFPIHFRNRSISDIWCFNKDGKCWVKELYNKRGKDMFEKDVPVYFSGDYLFTLTIKDLYRLLGK